VEQLLSGRSRPAEPEAAVAEEEAVRLSAERLEL
jgi:hypothetical protein